MLAPKSRKRIPQRNQRESVVEEARRGSFWVLVGKGFEGENSLLVRMCGMVRHVH